MSARGGAVILTVAALSLALSGCAEPPRAELSASEVTGTWSAVNDDFGTRVVIRADGRFELEDAPALVVSYTPGPDLLSCGGVWTVNPDDFIGVPNLLLECAETDEADALSGRSFPLLGRIVDSELVLFFVLGDPDSARWLDLTRG